MNRKNQVKICENCTHCKQDINRGIICGLTNEYATFEAGARSSTQTIPISQNARLENKEADNGPNHIRDLPVVFFTYLFCLISSLVGDDNPNVTWVLLAVSVVIIGISLCIFFTREAVIYGATAAN